jgi:argonaute-like protein implicated in RNA metabolism and viral defense
MAFYKYNKNVYSLDKLAEKLGLDKNELGIELDKGYSVLTAVQIVRRKFNKLNPVEPETLIELKRKIVATVSLTLPNLEKNIMPCIYGEYEAQANDRKRIFNLMYNKN